MAVAVAVVVVVVMVMVMVAVGRDRLINPSVHRPDYRIVAGGVCSVC